MTTRRQERVSEMLQEELGVLVTELTDPRLEDAMLVVTEVEVSQDLRSARVYVDHQLPATASRHVLDALHHAEGFLRRGLVERLDLRYVPHLFFHIDNSETRGLRIENILRTLSQPAVTPDNEQSDDAE